MMLAREFAEPKSVRWQCQSVSHSCLVVMATSTEWWWTDWPTNHFLVPVCHWFVSCIGRAAWEKWHGACYRTTGWYAYVFASAWSLLAWSTGAKDLPRRHEWFWCPMFSSLDQQDNLLKTWCVPLSFVLFRGSCYFQYMMVLSVLCGGVGKTKDKSWQHTPNKSQLVC